MSSLPIIDLIAGLIFIYFLMAIVNNSCLELFSSAFRWRAIMLSSWMKKTVGAAVYQECGHSTTGVMVTETAPYIEAKDFARMITTHVFQNEIPGAVCNPSELRELIKGVSFSEPLKKLLENFALKAMAETTEANTGFNLTHFETQIEDWFSTHMRYLTTSYKRKSMVFTFVFATVLTVALNIDTLQLASYLYGNREARELLASRAAEVSKLPTYVEHYRANPAADSLTNTTRFASIQAEPQGPENTRVAILPLGWSDHALSEKVFSLSSIIKKAGGLFMTIMAICLGAPFWFEVLGKIANLRSSLKPIEK